MQIPGQGPIPFSAARAYGRPATAPATASPAVAPGRSPAAAPTAPAFAGDAPRPGIAERTSHENTAPLRRLVPAPPADRAATASRLTAGRVPGRVQFDDAGPGSPAASAPAPAQRDGSAVPGRTALPFHARAADRFEAGLGVARGRILDVRG
ncbi:MAG: hypothetical protein AB8G96_05705 [Phycisphaerales bacterium]